MQFMRLKISSKWLLLLLSIVGIILSLIIIFFQGSYMGPASSQIQQNLFDNNLTGSLAESIVSSKQSNFGLPLRLKIPVINVNAVISSVGLTSQGAMGSPKGFADVVWFKLGPRPGDNGSAVMAGHYGLWKNGKGSVFDNLYKLRKGDKLYVEDDKGNIISFVVRESRSYDVNADASEVFSSNDGKAHLNLITCEGVWNNISKTYSKRLVIFADKK